MGALQPSNGFTHLLTVARSYSKPLHHCWLCPDSGSQLDCLFWCTSCIAIRSREPVHFTDLGIHHKTIGSTALPNNHLLFTSQWFSGKVPQALGIRIEKMTYRTQLDMGTSLVNFGQEQHRKRTWVVHQQSWYMGCPLQFLEISYPLTISTLMT